MALTDTGAAAFEAWIPEDSFATRLLRTRRDLGLSVDEAASLCGLKRSTWGKWENGTMPRDLGQVCRKIKTGLSPLLPEGKVLDLDWLVWGFSPNSRVNLDRPALAVVPTPKRKPYQPELPVATPPTLTLVPPLPAP